MKVILTENVKSVGNIGDIIKVSDGFGRNFLLPRKLAIIADKANEKFAQNERKRLQKKIEEEKSAARVLISKVEGVVLNFQRKVAGNGKLFGTVNAMDIASELAKQNIEVEKRMIAIPVPIKSTGEFDAIVKFFADVTATIKVKVEMDANQAEEIKKKSMLAEKRAKAKKEEAAKNPEGAEVESALETETEQSE